MRSNNVCSKPILVILFSLIVSLSFMSTTAFARRAPVVEPIINPVTFAGKDISIYKSEVSGSSYGWKILLVIRISSPSYEEAVNDLWKNAEIPKADRSKYELVNIRQTNGTEWGIWICGQNYLTVKADIINKSQSHLNSK